MTTDPPPPRRNWHFTRWLIVLIIAMFGWSGWQAYAFRTALSQAEALGWKVIYTDPVETIRKNWKAAFKKETWLDGVTGLGIPTGEAFEHNFAIVHRLNPSRLKIEDASTLRELSTLKPRSRLQLFALFGGRALTHVDLNNLPSLQKVILDRCPLLTNVDGLKNLSALETVSLRTCTGLTNVDALKNLSALKEVILDRCTGLTNVDVLKNLPGLQAVSLRGCTGLTPESIGVLKAALPNAKITGP